MYVVAKTLTRHSELRPIWSFVQDPDLFEARNFGATNENDQFPGGAVFDVGEY